MSGLKLLILKVSVNVRLPAEAGCTWGLHVCFRCCVCACVCVCDTQVQKASCPEKEVGRNKVHQLQDRDFRAGGGGSFPERENLES